MRKLKATILKDLRILMRDRVGLILMFAMPILLVLIITSLQNNTFKIVNSHQVPMVIFMQDQGVAAGQFYTAIDDIGMFAITVDSSAHDLRSMEKAMNEEDALVGLVVPEGFSEKMLAKAKGLTSRALSDMGLYGEQQISETEKMTPLNLYYNPVLQESYRFAIEGGISSALQLIESRQMIGMIYKSVNDSEIPADLEEDILNNRTALNKIPITQDGSGQIPNASQHNIPAWTIFAMFFIVTSLGSSLVKEKLSGSFIRLKTMSYGYFTAILSRQLVYLGVALMQVVVIFSIGIWVFPLIGLPALNMPQHFLGLFMVSLVCGLCAVSYALCLGVFAETQEQVNGFGAVSIVILAALGGILVPAFAMPETFQLFTVISPLYWCLESYYGLFLAGGKLIDVMDSLLSLLIFIIALQILAFIGLKWKNLI